MNIGVLGGTFDPVHNGHLIVAGEVKARLGLAAVIFVPAGQPWLKADWPVTPAEHRLRMLRLALADQPDFKISTLEIERAGPSYTVDTMAELREQASSDDELFFILGRDNLAQIPQWQDPSRLIEMCYLVAVNRPGALRPKLKSLEKTLVPSDRWVIGTSASLADITLFSLVEFFDDKSKVIKILESTPKLFASYSNFSTLTQIKEWVDNRPVTPF